jgi:hypothetical protein
LGQTYFCAVCEDGVTWGAVFFASAAVAGWNVLRANAISVPAARTFRDFNMFVLLLSMGI